MQMQVAATQAFLCPYLASGRFVVANSGAYGFTNVTDPCFNGTTVCSNPSEYLFFDDFHPTKAADRFVADGFLTAVVPEPETYALLLAGLGFLGFMARRRK